MTKFIGQCPVCGWQIMAGEVHFHSAQPDKKPVRVNFLWLGVGFVIVLVRVLLGR